MDIDKDSGLAVYKRPSGAAHGWSKLSPGLSFKQTLFETGVTGSPQVRKGGKLMMLTCISYIIIQVSSAAWSPVYILYRVEVGHRTAVDRHRLCIDFRTYPDGGIIPLDGKLGGWGWVASDMCGGAVC